MSGLRSPRAACALLVVALAVTGCSGTQPAEPDDAPRPGSSTTSLADHDTEAVVVARGPFCDRVRPSAADAALDGVATTSEEYGNGDLVTLAPGVEDVAHEFGCRHRRGRTEASAWLFAPPVTPARGRELVAALRTTRGCSVDTGAPDFGSPSVAALCTSRGSATASYRGLFGDAWLSCSITVPLAGLDRPELFDRTGRWCVEVVEAASA